MQKRSSLDNGTPIGLNKPLHYGREKERVTKEKGRDEVSL